jgi:hypothetical protein
VIGEGGRKKRRIGKEEAPHIWNNEANMLEGCRSIRT